MWHVDSWRPFECRVPAVRKNYNQLQNCSIKKDILSSNLQLSVRKGINYSKFKGGRLKVSSSEILLESSESLLLPVTGRAMRCLSMLDAPRPELVARS